MALLGVLTLTACYGAPKVGEAFDGVTDDYEGATMTVVEGSAMPGGVTVEVLNTTEAEIGGGNAYDFRLQREQDGRWYWLEPRGGVRQHGGGVYLLQGRGPGAGPHLGQWLR